MACSPNIRIGIDLGTTNSEIAVSTDGIVEIVKNMYGSEYTPSVFGFDKANNKVVGKKAYEKLFKDTSDEEIRNYKAEVKRIMGTGDTVFFPRANKSLTPEEISAEILKSLKEDVVRRYPGILATAAVITTPASFSTIQAEATKRAGNLAGFSHVVLLQEPIAAAIAYEYQKSDDENFLVYDLGGGTFDVALITMKGGVLSVLGHNGNNFLGGKDFDKVIVTEIIIPEILGKYSIRDFDEGNARFKAVFAQLKYLAEVAKTDLSQYLKTTIDIAGIRGLETDDNGKEIAVSIGLTRERFEQLIKPKIDETIDLARKTILDSSISASSVTKILLVGGPTQIPFIRDRLERELKIPINTTLDPLTVVAKGAGIYAIGQEIPDALREAAAPAAPGTMTIALHFNPLTSETEEIVSGVISSLQDPAGEYFIQIQSESGHYTSVKIRLKNGKFISDVSLLPKRNNLFWLYLFDSAGNTVPVQPDSFSITHGLSISGAPIPHAIGVAVAKKDINKNNALTEIFEAIFEKGRVLPLKSEPQKYRTVKKLVKGEDNSLPIKVYEGESDIPDRNTFICDVKIEGKELPYDLPENTEVELVLRVDESRVVDLDVFIPAIDRTLAARGSILAENVDLEQMRIEYAAEIKRAQKIEEDCSIEERLSVLRSMDGIDTSLKNAPSDPDEKRKAVKQLKDFKMLLDGIEKKKEMPQLIKEYHSMILQIEKMNEQIGLPEERKRNLEQVAVLKTEGEKAIAENDKFLLMRVNDQVRDLGSRIYLSHPAAWVQQFNLILEKKPRFINQKEAQYYIEKGKRCIQQGDIEGLRDSVIKLLKLMPLAEQAAITTSIAGIMR